MKVILLCYTLFIIPALNSGQSHSYFFRPSPQLTQQPNPQIFERFPYNNNFGLQPQQTQQSHLGLVQQQQQQQQTPYSGGHSLNQGQLDNGSPFLGPPLGNIQQYFPPVQQQYQQQFPPTQNPQLLQQPESQEFYPLKQDQQQLGDLQQFRPQGPGQLQLHGLHVVQPVRLQQQLQQSELQRFQATQQAQQLQQSEVQQIQPIQQPRVLQQVQPQGLQYFQSTQQTPQLQQHGLQQIQPIEQVQQPPELQHLEPQGLQPFQPVQQQPQLQQPGQQTLLLQQQLFQESPLQHFRHGTFRPQQQPEAYPFLHARQQQQIFLPTKQTEQLEPLVLKHFRLADQQQKDDESQQAPDIGQLEKESTQPSSSPADGTLMTISPLITPTLEGQVQTSEVESPPKSQSTAAKEQNSEEESIRKSSTEVPLNASTSDHSYASTTTMASVSQEGRNQRRIERRGQRNRRPSKLLTTSTSVNSLGQISTSENPPVTSGSTAPSSTEGFPATTYKSKFLYSPTTSKPINRLTSGATVDAGVTLAVTQQPEEPEPSTYKSKFKFVPKETANSEKSGGQSRPKVNISRALTLQRIISFRASSAAAAEMKKGGSTTKRPVNISRRPLLRPRPTTTERDTED